MPQLVASSGVLPFQLPSQPPPSRIGAEPPEPPFIEMPGSARISETLKLPKASEPVGHAVALPGVPFPPGPKELISFHAPEPTGGKPLEQPAPMPCVVSDKPGRF